MEYYSKILKKGFTLAVMLMATVFLLNGCGGSKNKELQKTYVVKKATIATPLTVEITRTIEYGFIDSQK